MKQSETVGAIVGSGDNKSSGMEKYNYLKNIRELTHVRRRRQDDGYQYNDINTGSTEYYTEVHLHCFLRKLYSS
jgi:hypothetical protein